jgi:hypothetical protein
MVVLRAGSQTSLPTWPLTHHGPDTRLRTARPPEVRLLPEVVARSEITRLVLQTLPLKIRLPHSPDADRRCQDPKHNAYKDVKKTFSAVLEAWAQIVTLKKGPRWRGRTPSTPPKRFELSPPRTRPEMHIARRLTNLPWSQVFEYCD